MCIMAPNGRFLVLQMAAKMQNSQFYLPTSNFPTIGYACNKVCIEAFVRSERNGLLHALLQFNHYMKPKSEATCIYKELN